MEIFGHPFASYCQKAFIAFHEHAIPYTLRLLGPDDPATAAEHRALWPLGKMPVLRDGARVLAESSIVIEYVDQRRPEGWPALIPADPDAALQVRMLDRIFDNFVMTPMQAIVADRLRPDDQRDPYGVAEARKVLDGSYRWLEGQLGDDGWAFGEFSLADCAAAPALFYADWVHEIPETCPALRAYRARLLARPSVARAIDDARPYRHFFPGGAPDRD